MTNHRATNRERTVWKWLAAAVLAAVLAFAAWHLPLGEGLRRALDAIHRLGPWGPVVFILLYIVACVCLVPGSVLTLGAGAVFGVVAGSIYVSLGATLGATAAFLIGRHLASAWVARKISGHAALRALDQAVAAEGWKIVGLTRLSPVFPFTLLNYAFGVTRVSARDYVLASWIGMLPGTVLYVYLGSLAPTNAAAPRTRAEWTLRLVGLLATVAVTVFITRRARQALAGKIPSATPP